jgi:diguanylate cyclase (GGDEF)-like protein
VGKVLIVNSKPEEREFLFKFAHQLGDVHTSSSLDKTLPLLDAQNFGVVVIDADNIENGAEAPALRVLLLKVPCLILTGRHEDLLKEAARRWPPDHFVDYVLISGKPADLTRTQRVLATADSHARLMDDLVKLRSSKESADLRLARASTEIKEIGNALSGSVVRELEKRIAVEGRYLKFRELKRRIEDTLRKLYAANDVSNLLDIVVDIKDLIQAEGISLYVCEENEALGRYLKPLVWDDAFLSHADFTRHVAPLSAQDFASHVGRTGQEINIADAARDPRCSRRYREQLRSPLRSILGAPLKKVSEIIGLIEAVNKIGPPGSPSAGFTPEDQQILRGLSEHVSLAMTKLNLIQYDALTGLLRPDPFFEKVIQKIVLRNKRRQETGISALVMGDVDWFKTYNDRNGHEAGNRLLRDLAGIMKSSIREEDLLCRYGGEEFLFFLSGVKNIEEAALLTERIRKNVEDHVFEYEEFQPRHDLTMSFGVTTFPLDKMGGGGLATKTLLKKAANEADMALAEAKGKKIAALKGGSAVVTKNKVCAYVREKAAVVTKTALLSGGPDKPPVEKRKTERYAATTLCIYRENGGHRVANTIDLSLGGVKISSKTPLVIDRILELFLILGNQANALRGAVVYCQRASAASAYYFSGIKFRGLAATDIETLEVYFAALERRGGGTA